MVGGGQIGGKVGNVIYRRLSAVATASLPVKPVLGREPAARSRKTERPGEMEILKYDFAIICSVFKI